MSRPAASRGPADTVPEGLPYNRIHEAGLPGEWRPLVGVVMAALGLLVVGALVALVPFLVWYAATGAQVHDSITRLVDVKHPTPAGLAYINLTLSTMIPISWLLNRSLHGLLPRWLASVGPRIRWRFLLACLGAAVIALVATVVVSSLLPGQSDDVGGHANAFTSTTRDYLLVVLFLTPFQAAGEEYLFRGYLTQAFGGITGFLNRPSRRVSALFAIVPPALLFGLAHGLGQSPPVFFDRFAFGLVAGTLVVLTGGLEAGIAMHVLNNWLAFGLALAYGDMASTLNPTGGSWWSIPVTLTQSLVYLGLAVLVARRMGVATVTTRPILEPSAARV
ncbi:CPBP family intramembrane glutamic endopeptidase [Nocardioides cynanchi]|uniref:CPBP family intramembrane glutamic endopeptidase n=1 Tax=Nocardioides cynanchi TaxID=2558918 RepID=UPI001EE21BD2|nr:CPBP family intramembrane glutamic endopeptidase [Nocardioides cynanchi]